ncbi:tetratricopeptide repeat protein [Flavobacterium chungangensis]|uniref:TolB amino-terminal domain-containing protein n=1 Tax=Flavobacterium chungangensis TaxID=2708132 RepID=A0ABV8ZF91_9FLAO
MESIKKIPTDKIYNELENVLKFYSFKNSTLLSNFLRYIVTETVDERQKHIKEYSIAVNALSRPSHFNPHDDAMVRIHAGRLRKLLNEYYSSEGKDNLVIIHVPKGGYIPEFIHNDKKKHVEVSISINKTNPVITVFPFKSSVERPDLQTFAKILSDEISAELSRFQDISVIGHFSSDVISKINENVLEAASVLGADFIITGHVQVIGSKLQLRVNLVDSSSGKYLLTQLFTPATVDDGIKIQNEIVKDIVSAIGGYYGSIFKEIAKTAPSKISNNAAILKAICSYHEYQCSFSIENYANALSSLTDAVELAPNHALTWAMLGEIHLASLGLGIDNSKKNIEKSSHCVSKALNIDPHCQQAWYAQALIHCFRKNQDNCLYAAEQCIKMNPNSSGIASGIGCMLIFAGYFEKGFNLLENASRLNLSHPWWINIGYWYYYMHKKEYQKMLYWAEKMDFNETIWDPLLKAVSLSLLNEEAAAKIHLNNLVELQPLIATEIKEILSNFMFSDEIVFRIVNSLKRIGLKDEV